MHKSGSSPNVWGSKNIDISISAKWTHHLSTHKGWLFWRVQAWNPNQSQAKLIRPKTKGSFTHEKPATLNPTCKWWCPKPDWFHFQRVNCWGSTFPLNTAPFHRNPGSKKKSLPFQKRYVGFCWPIMDLFTFSSPENLTIFLKNLSKF